MSIAPSTTSQHELDVPTYGAAAMDLPGMGESAVDCGVTNALGFCIESGHVQYQDHLCGRRECPRCWSTQWSGPRTASVVARLGAFRQQSGNHPRTIHAVLSPPEIETVDDFYRYRSKATQRAKEHGIIGGITIPHPFRVYDWVKDAYKGLVKIGEVDTSLWRWIRENDESWRSQTYWSPHYHIVGTVRRSGDIDPGDGGDGWVFKNIRSLDPFHPSKPEGYEDMASVTRYLLSHAGFEADGNRQAVTWFGAHHGVNFDPEKELSSGRWSQIQRIASEVVGSEVDLEEIDVDGLGELEESTCQCDGCDSEVISVWDLPMAATYYEPVMTWPGPIARRNRAIYEIETGRAIPPPGHKNPRTAEEYEAMVDEVLDRGYFI